MNLSKEETIALEESIDTWVRRGEGEEISEGFSNCALCRLVAIKPNGRTEYIIGDYVNCQTCIIFKRTGKIECYDTPYRHAVESPTRIHEEIEFLKSFRNKIQVGVKVKCKDGSYSMCITPQGLKNTLSNICDNKKYIVIAMNLELPEKNNHRKNVMGNDTIIQDIDSGVYIFSRMEFLRPLNECTKCGTSL